MNLRVKNTLKTISYISLCIVFMLFLLFFLTYDFKQNAEYSYEDEKVLATDELSDIVKQSIDDSYTLNLLKLDVDADLLNRFIHYMIIEKYGDFTNLYFDDFFSLKGIKLELKEDTVLLNIYTTYNDFMNYPLHVKVFLTFNDKTDSYVLGLKRIVVGGIIIPRSLTERILANKKTNSLSLLIENSLSKLPFGNFNKKDLELTIKKQEIVDSIENGSLGNVLNTDDEQLRIAVASLTSILFSNDLIKFDLKKSALSIGLDYSKSINSIKTIDYIHSKNDLYDKDYSEYDSIDYNLVLYQLLGYDEITLNDYELNSLFLKLILKDTVQEINSFINFDFSKISIYNNEIHLSLIFKALEKYVVIDYVFVLNGTNLSLSRIDIGRDEGENELSYISISSYYTKDIVFKLLLSYGLEENVVSGQIKLSSIFLDSRIYLFDVECDNNFVILKIDNMGYDVTEEVLLSHEFNNYSSIKIDYSSKESLIKDFSELTYQEKQTYLKDLKEFYKNETSVYNYIGSLID